MLFNSYVFLFVFLPVTLVGFYLLARFSAQAAAGWLVMTSLVFYGYWNPRYVPLLLASVLFNYACGSFIIRSRRRGSLERYSLYAGVAANILVLGYFKYAGFLINSINALSGAELPTLQILLPLGISFYSFTQIAFLVDAADGRVTDANPLHYFVFVTYFPHLIAGPVLHHHQVMPQFARPSTYRWHWKAVSVAIAVFTIGIAKKVLIADNLAEYANSVFNAIPAGTTPKLFGAWGGALAYSFQLYFDFSGYSDMAVGLSLLFNVRLPFNFNSPYKSVNVIDFWRRWHITLSQFLRDYLYIRLGGNRHGETRRMTNLMITMLLGGLWHGANWTFVIWGGVHGSALVVNHLWLKVRRKPAPARSMAAVLATFLFVTLAWVIFRSDSFSTAIAMYRAMLGLNGLSVSSGVATMLAHFNVVASSNGIFERNLAPYATLGVNRFIFLMLLCMVIAWGCPNTQQLLLIGKKRALARGMWRSPRFAAVALSLLFCIVLSNLERVSTFLYYQF